MLSILIFNLAPAIWKKHNYFDRSKKSTNLLPYLQTVKINNDLD